MIKAVILDFDDTLCLTEEACFYLENETLEAMGRPPMSRELHKKTWGKPLFEVIKERSPGIDVAEFRKAYDPFIKNAVSSGKLDSIASSNIEAIDMLIKEGRVVTVLTSREHSELKHMLEPKHELYERIEAFYYKDNMKYHKPDPKAFAHIEEQHGWRPIECVYVGDSISDAVAAKGAGMHFIASLESGLRRREDFADYDVDVFISKFPDVVEAVRKLDKQSKP